MQGPHAPDAPTELWPARIGQLFTGDPEVRDRARWQVYVVEIVRRLERYVPTSRPFPAVLDGVTLEQIQAAQAEDGDRTILAAFAAWRADVRHMEVTNEKRLLGLANALGWTRELRERGIVERELADRYEQRLCTHLTDVWKLEPPSLEDSPRAWAAEHSRRYDLLPSSWRIL
jgi:hypothetical protein